MGTCSFGCLLHVFNVCKSRGDVSIAPVKSIDISTLQVDFYVAGHLFVLKGKPRDVVYMTP